jgi:flagellar biosynthesis protein FliP
MIHFSNTGRPLLLLAFVLGMTAAVPPHALASPSPAPAPQAGSLQIPIIDSRNNSLPWSVLILFTILTLLPALLLSMTPFVRILIVFHFLRQALGTTTAPTNQTLLGLALFLTYFIMQPVGVVINKVSIQPLTKGSITVWEALDRSANPMRQFMLKFTREKDLALFVELAHEPRPRRPEDLPMRIVVPAYIISELKTGFQIGAVLFLPFLVIDMLVAAVTTSIGMFQLPPVVISTPLKILLFVVADGWNLVVGSTLKSFF